MKTLNEDLCHAAEQTEASVSPSQWQRAEINISAQISRREQRGLVLSNEDDSRRWMFLFVERGTSCEKPHSSC